MRRPNNTLRVGGLAAVAVGIQNEWDAYSEMIAGMYHKGGDLAYTCIGNTPSISPQGMGGRFVPLFPASSPDPSSVSTSGDQFRAHQSRKHCP